MILNGTKHYFQDIFFFWSIFSVEKCQKVEEMDPILHPVGQMGAINVSHFCFKTHGENYFFRGVWVLRWLNALLYKKGINNLILAPIGKMDSRGSYLCQLRYSADICPLFTLSSFEKLWQKYCWSSYGHKLGVYKFPGWLLCCWMLLRRLSWPKYTTEFMVVRLLRSILLEWDGTDEYHQKSETHNFMVN